MVDNRMPGMLPIKQRSGRPLKSIKERLIGKQGRVRGNLMGKRVDFSARTVITADANIALDELGVPHKIASSLTYPETVTSFNKHILQKYVDQGPTAPIGTIGAKYVFGKGGARKDLRFAKNVVLEQGDIVERHRDNFE